jgi:CHAT domain-containing protein/Tfp pilus assembly protein PilF
VQPLSRLPARRLAVLAAALILFLMPLLAAASPPNGGGDRQQERLRDRWVRQANQLCRQGKWQEGIVLAEKVVALERKLAGAQHSRVAERLGWLAFMHEQRQDFPSGEKARREALALWVKARGKGHWRVTDARLALDYCRRRAGLTAAARKRLVEADRQIERAAKWQAEGKFAAGVPHARDAVGAYKAVLGAKHPRYADCLNWLALLHKLQGEHDRARPLYEEALAVRKQALGERHPMYAQSLNNLALLHETTGDFGRALPLLEEAVAVFKKAHGESHPEHAKALNNLAMHFRTTGDYGRARTLLEQAHAIYRKTLGEQHPDYAMNLVNLANFYKLLGDTARARPLYEQALAVRKKVLGEKHPDYAGGLSSLADLYLATGDYARARPLFEQAHDITRATLGVKHPAYAASLTNLAGLCKAMRDHAGALPLYEQARDIYREAYGEKHPDYAGSLNNLAGLYKAVGEHARARPLYEQALAIRQKVYGEKHLSCAQSLNDLGLLCGDLGEHARAVAMLRQSREVYRLKLGDRHPSHAMSLNNLAWVHQQMGDFAAALPLYEQSLAIRRQAQGERHPDYAQTLGNLALLCKLMGDDGRARSLAEQSLQLTRQHLELSAAGQSERQQLAMARALRYRLDVMLSFSVDAPTQRAYPAVLAWKGAVLTQQQRRHAFARLARHNRDPEVERLVGQLQDTTRLLASLALTGDPSLDSSARSLRLAQLARLGERKDRLEAELARRSAEFRLLQAQRQLSSEALRGALPAGVALVDFLEYTHWSPSAAKKGAWQREGRLVAFVLRRDRPTARVELGPSRPVAGAVQVWRGALRRGVALAGDVNPAAMLRQRLWLPLARHLSGAETVLLSPDGALAWLPFAALPGSKPDSYLIEEVGLAVVPVPRLIPELLAERHGGGAASLLLVGDVDFNAATPGSGGRTPATRGLLRDWGELTATRQELLAIKDSFQQRHAQARTTELRQAQATTAAVRREVGRHRYLHLATHAFFAPPELRSALASGRRDRGAPGPFGAEGVGGWHPGLLSGLVLAGANRRPAAGRDEGILTALEVAELDLGGVELAVLSACETGLGRTVGGEGVLGLQRAFQVAGARATLTSLWKVEDEATRALMVRFYERLWDRSRAAGRLQALRQAQLWLLHEGVRRGMVRREKEEPSKRTPPFFWAGFVLAGDWR